MNPKRFLPILACMLSLEPEKIQLSNTIPDEFAIQERAARGLVNADRENALMKQDRLNQLLEAFEKKGYGEFDRTRQSFVSMEEFREYKRICRHIRQTKKELKYFLKQADMTETRIREFCNQFVGLSIFLRVLRYADKINQLHDLTIFVNSGSLTGDFRVAQTKFQISDQDELYWPVGVNNIRKHAVNITLDKRGIERDGLLHEIGHVLALAAQPRLYYRQLRERPCDFDCQRNRMHPVALPAIQLQEWGRFLQKSGIP